MSDPTVSAFLTKVLCKNGGRLPRDLLPTYWGLKAKKIKKILQDEPQKFSEVGKMVLARSPVRTCSKYLRGEAEEECDKLHLCRNHLRGKCWPGRRPRCPFSHDILSDQNRTVLKANEISGLNEDEIKVLLLQNDNHLLPEVCVKYLHDSCDLGKDCSWLHICGFFTRGECNRRSCKFSHHLLEFGSDLLLTRHRFPEETIENFQMICTAKYEELLQKVWAERKKEKKKEQEKEKGQEQQERARSQDRREESKEEEEEEEKPGAQRGKPPNSKKEEEKPGAQRGRPQKEEEETPGAQKGRGRPQNSKMGNPQKKAQRKGRGQQGNTVLDHMLKDWLSCPPHESKDRLDLYFKTVEHIFPSTRP